MHLLLLFRNIHKPGQFRFPAKIYGSDRAVTLFRDNNLRRVPGYPYPYYNNRHGTGT